MNAPDQTRTLARTDDAPAYGIQNFVPGGRDLILNPGNLRAIIQISEFMSQAGAALPKHFAKNQGACMAVAMQAMRWNMDPFALATKTYLIDGQPLAYEGQAIIAALNNSPLLTSRLAFTWDGPWDKIIGKFVWKDAPPKNPGDKPKRYLQRNWKDDDETGLSCTVTASLVGEKEPRVLQLFLMQARVRNSPLWVEDPRQQLAYLASRRWGRLYAPDVIMGVYTPDEVAEIKHMGEVELAPHADWPEKAAIEAAGKGSKAYASFWSALHRSHPDCTAYMSTHPDHMDLKERAIEADRAAHPAPTPKPTSTPAPSPAPTAASEADPKTGETTPPPGDAFVPTYATVLDRMLKSKDAIGVEVAAEWIADIGDDEQRKELEAKRDELLAAFKGGN